MIKGYKTIQEIAVEWGITTRRVQVLCSKGKIEGAVKFGRSWAIPEETEKPNDGRVTSGQYRNWRRSKKKV